MLKNRLCYHSFNLPIVQLKVWSTRSVENTLLQMLKSVLYKFKVFQGLTTTYSEDCHHQHNHQLSVENSWTDCTCTFGDNMEFYLAFKFVLFKFFTRLVIIINIHIFVDDPFPKVVVSLMCMYWHGFEMSNHFSVYTILTLHAMKCIK